MELRGNQFEERLEIYGIGHNWIGSSYCYTWKSRAFKLFVGEHHNCIIPKDLKTLHIFVIIISNNKIMTTIRNDLLFVALENSSMNFSNAKLVYLNEPSLSIHGA